MTTSHQVFRYQDQLVMTIMTELDASSLWIDRKHTALGKYFGYVPDIKEPARQQFQRMNNILSDQLLKSKGPFLMGTQFTAADILYGQCLDWALLIGWEDVLQSESLDAYTKAYRKRPAYMEAKKLRSLDSKSVIKRLPPLPYSNL